MSIQFRKPTPGAVPIHVVDRAGLAAAMQRTDANTRRWLTVHGFDGKPGSIVLVPDARAALGSVWAGVTAPNHPHALAALPGGLPPGTYRLGSDGLALDAQAAALSWRLELCGLQWTVVMVQSVQRTRHEWVLSGWMMV